MDVYYKKTNNKCKLCGTEATRIIDLPNFPLTDILFSEPTEVGNIDQGLDLCYVCGHGQLSSIVSLDILYGPEYSLRTSQGAGPKHTNLQLLNFIDEISFRHNKKFDHIIEVGCNDGYLLKSLTDKADKLIGIDPILKDFEGSYDDKITVIGDYVENVQLDKYSNALILASHMIEHVENPKKMLEKILASTDDDAIFIFQFPNFYTLIKDGRFDQVYSHHLHYFSLFSFTRMLHNLGCLKIKWEIDPHYFGTLTIAFQKGQCRNTEVVGSQIDANMILESYDKFKSQIRRVDKQIRSFSDNIKYAYGAGLQLPVLAYHLQNSFSCFKYILDDDISKDGYYFPNIQTQIVQPINIEKFNLEDAVVFVSAANFSRSILTKLIPLKPARIILPYNILI